MLGQVKSKRLLLVVGGLVILGAIAVHGGLPSSPYPVHEIDSLAQAQQELDTCNTESLILFDVDDTLITSPDPLVRGHELPLLFCLRILLSFPQTLKTENWEIGRSIIWRDAPRPLIEANSIQLIKSLKAKGCPVLGLTYVPSGSYGVIPHIPEWRYTMLKNRGIIFSQTYPDATFANLPTNRHQHPVLYKGILCTNQVPKGQALEAFLDTYQVKPNKIIFFDDGIRHLQSVGKTCQKKGIPCTLFLYRGAEKLAGTWNTERALKQIDYLVKEKKWAQAI